MAKRVDSTQAWRRLRRDLINVYKYPKGRYKEDRARLICLVPEQETTGTNPGHSMMIL